VAVAALGATQDTQPDAGVVIGDVEALGAAATPSMYTVVASMGRYDETAVRQLLNSPAPYVGLVASRRRGDAVVEDLRGEGLSEDSLGRRGTGYYFCSEGCQTRFVKDPAPFLGW
jgi:xanthine/CO dehydrogenase XdhC/CoxF family maturation factor